MFKWPFASRGVTKKVLGAVSEASVSSLDFSLYMNNDAYIKVWLPDRISVGLDSLSASNQTSRPDVLRSILFRHAYGTMAYAALMKWKLDNDAAKNTTGFKFSPQRTSSIEFLGKSTENLKIWIPMALKNDLAQFACSDGLGISDYVRKILVREFLGECFYKNWRKHVGDVPKDIQLEESAEQ